MSLAAGPGAMISEHGALRRRGKPWALFLVMLTPGGGDKTEPGVAPARLSQAAGQLIGRSLSTDGEWSSLEPPGHDYGRVLLRWRSTNGTFIRVAALRPLRHRVNLRLVRQRTFGSGAGVESQTRAQGRGSSQSPRGDSSGDRYAKGTAAARAELRLLDLINALAGVD
jgi:hypothetical protein